VTARVTRWGIARAYGDFERMLADPDLDLIYLCTPVGAHLSMAAAQDEALRPRVVTGR
jgi:predicted dehydrogenase